MTAARSTPPSAAARRIASQSAGSRNGCTPASLMPGIGGMSGCEPVASDELVERELVDVVEPEHAALGVDPGDHAADEQLDAVVGVPLGGRSCERLRVLAADEDLRQPDAVVRRAALAADQRDRDVAVALAQRLADRLAGDAAADDDNPGAHASHRGEPGFPDVP